MIREDKINSSNGNKAYHSYIMQKAGLNVPAFAVFRYELYSKTEVKKQLQEFQERYNKQELSLEELSHQLKSFAKVAFEEEDMDEVYAYTQSFSKQTSFAIRSSANAEDQARQSFAGQFNTQSNVKPDQLEVALLNTLLSLYELSALNYFLTQAISLDEIEMIVMVQEMIVGEISGVYFTANPQGILNEHVIVAGFGLGSGIVEDKVPTSMTILHPDRDENKDIQPNLDVAYSELNPNAPHLNHNQITQLVDMAYQVMGLFGDFLDIEFTFKNNRLYVLQARQITTLPEGPIFILDNSNIVESYPGISTPLTISFVKEAYRQVFRGLAKRVLRQSDEQINQYDSIFSNMLADVNSRIYYQIHNWYELLHMLPFSKKIIPIWQDMLGVRNLEQVAPTVKLSFIDKSRVIFGIIRAFVRSPRAMAKLDDDFIHIQQHFESNYSKQASIKELRNLFTEIKTAILEQWDITLINDLYAFIFTGLLNKSLQQQAVPSEIAGVSQIESMKPMHALNKIIEEISLEKNKAYQEKLFNLNEDELDVFLARDQHQMTQMIVHFIDEFGDRAPGELKLETVTYRVQPIKLIQMIKQQTTKHLSQQTKLPNNIKKDEIKLPFLSRFFREHAILGIKYRESSRMNRTRIYGMVRTIFLTIGQRFVEANILEEVRDIFYLTMEEIFSIDEDLSVKLLVEKIRDRKQQLKVDQQLPAFNRLVFVGEVFNRYPSTIQNIDQDEAYETVLQGIGCSTGRIKAEVIVINDLQAIGDIDVQGKIIVTTMTDPGWVYLLTQAIGIIAEKGSLLSHTAIISRELKIPSIVNVKNVTQRLKTGEVIEMDGLSGQIKRV